MGNPNTHVWNTLNRGQSACWTTTVATPHLVHPDTTCESRDWESERKRDVISTTKENAWGCCYSFLSHTAPQGFVPQPAVESSSLPFGQSLSPSQSQCRGTQAWEPWQLNMSAAQVMASETQRENAIKLTACVLIKA